MTMRYVAGVGGSAHGRGGGVPPPTILPNDWEDVSPASAGYCYLILVARSEWQTAAFRIGPSPTWYQVRTGVALSNTHPLTRKQDRTGCWHIYQDGVGVSLDNLGFVDTDRLGAIAMPDDYFEWGCCMAAGFVLSMCAGSFSSWPMYVFVVSVITLVVNRHTDVSADHGDYTIGEFMARSKSPNASVFRDAPAASEVPIVASIDCGDDHMVSERRSEPSDEGFESCESPGTSRENQKGMELPYQRCKELAEEDRGSDFGNVQNKVVPPDRAEAFRLATIRGKALRLERSYRIDADILRSKAILSRTSSTIFKEQMHANLRSAFDGFGRGVAFIVAIPYMIEREVLEWMLSLRVVKDGMREFAMAVRANVRMLRIKHAIMPLILVGLWCVTTASADHVIERVCTEHAGRNVASCVRGLNTIDREIMEEISSEGSADEMCLTCLETRQRLLELPLWWLYDEEGEFYWHPNEKEDPNVDVVRMRYIMALCPNADAAGVAWWPVAKDKTYAALAKRRVEDGKARAERERVKNGEMDRPFTPGRVVDDALEWSATSLGGVAFSAVGASNTLFKTARSVQDRAQAVVNGAVEDGASRVFAATDLVMSAYKLEGEIWTQLSEQASAKAGPMGKKYATKIGNVVNKAVDLADEAGSLGIDAVAGGVDGALAITKGIKDVAEKTIHAAVFHLQSRAEVPKKMLDGTVNMLDGLVAELPSGASVGEHVGKVAKHAAEAAVDVATVLITDGVNIVSSSAAEVVEWRGLMSQTYSTIKADAVEVVPAVYSGAKLASEQFGINCLHLQRRLQEELDGALPAAYQAVKTEGNNFRKSLYEAFYSPEGLKEDIQAVARKTRSMSANFGEGALDVGAQVINWAASKSADDWKQTVKNAAEALPGAVEVLARTAITPVKVVVTEMNIDKQTVPSMIKDLREAIIGESPLTAATAGVKSLREAIVGETPIVDAVSGFRGFMNALCGTGWLSSLLLDIFPVETQPLLTGIVTVLLCTVVGVLARCATRGI